VISAHHRCDLMLVFLLKERKRDCFLSSQGCLWFGEAETTADIDRISIAIATLLVLSIIAFRDIALQVIEL